MQVAPLAQLLGLEVFGLSLIVGFVEVFDLRDPDGHIALIDKLEFDVFTGVSRMSRTTHGHGFGSDGFLKAYSGFEGFGNGLH